MLDKCSASVYQKFVMGLPGVPFSDPLRLESIVADLPSLKFVLKNPKLIGLKNCDFLKLKLNKEGSTFTYELLCPRLMIQSEYEVKGEIDAVAVAGNSNCEDEYDNYYITINGNYERVKGEDGKLHFKIVEFSLNLDLQAGATSEYQNIAIDGKESAEEYTKKLEEQTRDVLHRVFVLLISSKNKHTFFEEQTQMNTFLQKWIQNLQVFQKVVPLEDLHVRYV